MDAGAASPPRSARHGWALAGIWLVTLLANLEKPVHVDDTALLSIAEHVARDPLHPMSGMVHWGAHPAPIHALNQPHLVPYLFAAARALGGGSLLGPRLVVAAFAALAIACFAWLARRVAPAQDAVAWTALAFLGPAFLPGQNLMADVPLLALGLLVLALLVRAGEPSARGGAPAVLAAGAACGIACLVKYTALPWLALFPAQAWARRDGRFLLGLAPALSVLGAYAAFNVWDYGAVHLLGRAAERASAHDGATDALIALGRGALFVVTLGAVSPHLVALVTTCPRRAWALGASLVAALALGAQVLAMHGPDAMRGEPVVVSVLRGVFFLAGLAALAHALAPGPQRGPSAPPGAGDTGTPLVSLLHTYAASTSAFVVAAAPFVAVRHVLLVLPALLLLSARRAPPARGRALAAALGASAALGVLLAVSDADLAASYRETAARWRDIAVTGGIATHRHPYFAGHWGWQWYARDAGLPAYDPGATRLVAGDLIIRPRLPDPPALDPSDAARCPLSATAVVPSRPRDFLRTMTERQGYYAVWQGLPWAPSAEPLEHFDLYVCH